MAESGYTPCACRDCMEIAISSDMTNPDLCWECEEAGCDKGEHECCVLPDEPECEHDIYDTTEEKKGER